MLAVVSMGELPAYGQAVQSYEVVVLGATPAGVAAAVSASKLGRRTLLLGDPSILPAPSLPTVTWLKGRTFKSDDDSSLTLVGDRIRSVWVLNSKGESEKYAGQIYIDATPESQLMDAAEDRHWIPVTDDKSTLPTQPKPDGLLLGLGSKPAMLVPYSALLPDTLTNLLVVGSTWPSPQDQAVLGQAAGVAVAIAIKQKVPAPMAEVRQIQAQLLEDSVTILYLDDMPRATGKAWAGAQLIALYVPLPDGHFEPEAVMRPRQFETWWPGIFPGRGAPGPIYQPANRRDAAETVWQFFRGTYLNPRPKGKAGKLKTKN